MRPLPCRCVGRWDEIDRWSGDGLRREVFFFSGDGFELYASLYAAEPISRPRGVALCNSWGIEADQANRLVHPLALEAARAGGAGLVFHYPGYGDSQGDPQRTTIEAMAGAAAAAVEEGRRRLPPLAWALAGLMLGASVAALAAETVRPEALLLVQPALQPSEYFADLEKRSARIAAVTRSGDDTLFGYSASPTLLSSAAGADERVAAALAGFTGRGAVVRYSAPKGTDEVPDDFERIEIDGTFRFAAPHDVKLGEATAGWLKTYVRERE